MRKDERKLLIYTYLLCIALFGNLAILKDPIDKKALIIGGVLCLVIGYAHYVIRKFYPDGDKFLLIFASILSIVGIAMIYRLEYDNGIKQVVWFIVGVIVYILTVVLLPDMDKLSSWKNLYLIATLVLMPLALIFGKEQFGATNWISIAGFFGFIFGSSFKRL